MCVIWDATTFLLCHYNNNILSYKEHLSFARKHAHLNKMKSGHMGNDKALIQRIELGKDNFDVEVKYSTTYMEVYDLVVMNMWGYVKFIIQQESRYVYSNEHEYLKCAMCWAFIFQHSTHCVLLLQHTTRLWYVLYPI